MAAELVQCLRPNMDCADICTATGAVATRRSRSNEAVIRAMLDVSPPPTGCAPEVRTSRPHAPALPYPRRSLPQLRGCLPEDHAEHGPRSSQGFAREASTKKGWAAGRRPISSGG